VATVPPVILAAAVVPLVSAVTRLLLLPVVTEARVLIPASLAVPASVIQVAAVAVQGHQDQGQTEEATAIRLLTPPVIAVAAAAVVALVLVLETTAAPA
jgi:hypothetical protein